MKNKKIVFGAVLVLFFVSLWLLATRQKQKGAPAITYVTPAPLLPSVMPKNLAEQAILYTDGPAYEFPGRVPYVSIVGRRSFQEEATRLLALLGITAPPQIITGSRGRMALVTQKTLEAAVSENPLSFAFTVASPSGSFVTGDATVYKNSAETTLREWSLLPEPFETSLFSLRYFRFPDPHPEEQSAPNGALVAQVDLMTTIQGFPVFSGDANTPSFSADFDGGNRLIKIRGLVLPSVKKSGEEITIISYQDALERLKNGNGVLSSVSLSPDSNNRFAAGGVPSNIAIERVILGYLYSPYQEYLVPVFVFTGKATTPKDNERVITTTVVSAL